MNAGLLGIAVIAGLTALIPSKKEERWNAPWASIALAVLSGLCVIFARVLG